MSPSENCETLAAELGGVAHRGVVQSADDLKALVDLAMRTYGRIYAVLNHTGNPPKGDLLEIADENWEVTLTGEPGSREFLDHYTSLQALLHN